MSGKELGELLQLIHNERAALNHIRDHLKKEFQRLSGDCLQEIRRKPHAFVGDTDPIRRRTALAYIVFELEEPLCELFEETLVSDSDSDVRLVAISGINLCYEESADARICKMLADIVLDSHENDHVRIAAYRSLFVVGAVPMEEWPSLIDFKFPNDVDWDFVRRFIV